MAVFPRAYVAADNAGSRAVVIVAWLFPVLATLAVAGRFYARKLHRLAFALDDWLILAALVSNPVPRVYDDLLNDNPGTCLGPYRHHLVMYEVRSMLGRAARANERSLAVYLGGIGHHERQLDASNRVALFKTLTALQFSFGTSLGLIKSAIILLLMRIFFTKRFKSFGRSSSNLVSE
ncbi:MAG: hypothetical protein Q9179_002769 [Wetmoreana sp. 5 TL-2023]